MEKVSSFIKEHIHYFICGATAVLIALFLIFGHPNEEGFIVVGGSPVEITETTTKFIEDAQAALFRVMNEDAPTDEQVIEEYADGWEGDEGLGASTTLDIVISRRKPDGDNDNGNGWQCSKYTAYLATGKKDYSAAHPDYGPVNGKNVAAWLVKNFGWKYIDTPVTGAIGSGGFNTLYGHTAMYLYSTGTNTAMVNDANYTPLTVSTHNMNIDGWVWVVPGDYEPDPEPTPTPEPQPEPISECKRWTLVRGDTLGAIMKTCTGTVVWGEAMNEYARSWVDESTGRTVFEGWSTYPGIGLYAGHVITKK